MLPSIVTSVNVDNNEFLNDGCAERLRDIEGLKQLSLQNTKLSDAAVSALKSLKDLAELDLTGTGLTADGIASLKKALPNCKIIH